MNFRSKKASLGITALCITLLSTSVPAFAESTTTTDSLSETAVVSEVDQVADAEKASAEEDTIAVIEEAQTDPLEKTDSEEQKHSEAPKDGFLKEDNQWTYYQNGQVASSYTGFVKDGEDTYYVQNGIVNFLYTGLAWSGEWYYFKNNKMDLSYTGFTTNEYGTWYVKNGMVLFDYNGLVWYDEWRYVKNSALDWHYTGLATNEYGTWYVKDGRIQFDYTGLAYCNGTWYYFDKNYRNLNYTGLSTNSYGTWYVIKGTVDFSYTGLAWCGAWYYFNRNCLDWNYTGICSNENGTWYVQKGRITFAYNGTAYANGGTYTIRNSGAVGAKFNVPGTSQTPTYPTGCEGAAATTLLRYYGINVSLDEMINAIPRENLRTENGKRVGPSIYEKFVGNPKGGYTSSNPGYGAFAPVVTKAMNNVLARKESRLRAYDLSGSSISTVYSYLMAGKPVMVWSTYNMQNPKSVNFWYIKQSDGSYQYFSYPRGTHVTILTGYDANNVYMMDVYGAVNKTFSRSTFEARYKLLYQQAIVLK